MYWTAFFIFVVRVQAAQVPDSRDAAQHHRRTLIRQEQDDGLAVTHPPERHDKPARRPSQPVPKMKRQLIPSINHLKDILDGKSFLGDLSSTRHLLPFGLDMKRTIEALADFIEKQPMSRKAGDRRPGSFMESIANASNTGSRTPKCDTTRVTCPFIGRRPFPKPLCTDDEGGEETQTDGGDLLQRDGVLQKRSDCLMKTLATQELKCAGNQDYSMEKEACETKDDCDWDEGIDDDTKGLLETEKPEPVAYCSLGKAFGEKTFMDVMKEWWKNPTMPPVLMDQKICKHHIGAFLFDAIVMTVEEFLESDHHAEMEKMEKKCKKPDGSDKDKCEQPDCLEVIKEGEGSYATCDDAGKVQKIVDGSSSSCEPYVTAVQCHDDAEKKKHEAACVKQDKLFWKSYKEYLAWNASLTKMIENYQKKDKFPEDPRDVQRRCQMEDYEEKKTAGTEYTDQIKFEAERTCSDEANEEIRQKLGKECPLYILTEVAFASDKTKCGKVKYKDQSGRWATHKFYRNVATGEEEAKCEEVEESSCMAPEKVYANLLPPTFRDFVLAATAMEGCQAHTCTKEEYEDFKVMAQSLGIIKAQSVAFPLRAYPIALLIVPMLAVL